MLIVIDFQVTKVKRLRSRSVYMAGTTLNPLPKARMLMVHTYRSAVLVLLVVKRPFFDRRGSCGHRAPFTAPFPHRKLVRKQNKSLIDEGFSVSTQPSLHSECL